MGITINAISRTKQGKGASRRLRKTEQIPAIVYGHNKSPAMIELNFHTISKILEEEDTFTSILDLITDKNKESVIIKEVQRHPLKQTVTHIDFLRIDNKNNIVTNTPLHFIGEEKNEAIKTGAVLNKFIVSIEISCLPQDMPHGIDIDISSLAIGDHLSLTDIILPKGVSINALQHEDIEAHNQTIASVAEPRLMAEEEEEEEITDEEDAASEEGAASEEDTEEKDSNKESPKSKE